MRRKPAGRRSRIRSIRYPPTTMTSLTLPARLKARRYRSREDWPLMDKRHFGSSLPRSPRRDPRPAARMMAFNSGPPHGLEDPEVVLAQELEDHVIRMPSRHQCVGKPRHRGNVLESRGGELEPVV